MSEENKNENPNDNLVVLDVTATDDSKVIKPEENGDFNIFNEIKNESAEKKEFEKEFEKQETKKYRGTYFYLRIVLGITKTLNYICVVLVILSFIYIKLQTSDIIKEESIPGIFCPLFIGRDLSDGTNCRTIQTLAKNIDNDYTTEEQNIIKAVNGILPDLLSFYSNDSRERKFLESVSLNKLKSLEVLDKFEKMKNSYDGKKKISCENIKIGTDRILEADCVAYSTTWDKIHWYSYSDETKNGRSISVALSFIDYIDAESPYFEIIEKPNEYSETEVNDEDIRFYQYKTDFKLKLQYTGDYILF